MKQNEKIKILHSYFLYLNEGDSLVSTVLFFMPLMLDYIRKSFDVPKEKATELLSDISDELLEDLVNIIQKTIDTGEPQLLLWERMADFISQADEEDRRALTEIIAIIRNQFPTLSERQSEGIDRVIAQLRFNTQVEKL